MGATDQTCRPSAEEVCKRFEKEVRKELCRLSVQRCCSPSVQRLEASRRPLQKRLNTLIMKMTESIRKARSIANA